MMTRLCAGGGYGGGYSYSGFSSPNPFGGYTASYSSRGYQPARYNYNGGYGGGGFRGGYYGGDQFLRSGHCQGGYQNARFGYNNGGRFFQRPGWFQTQNGPVYAGFNTYFSGITHALNGLYGGNFSGGYGGLGGFGGGFGSIV